MLNCDWQPHVANAAQWECFFPAGQLSVCWWATWCLKSILSTNSGFPPTITVVLLWGDVVLIQHFGLGIILLFFGNNKMESKLLFFSLPQFQTAGVFFSSFFLYTHAWRSLISLWKRTGGVWISQCELEIIFRCSCDCYSQSIALVWGDVITAYSNWTSVFLQHAARQQNWTLTLTWISMLQHQGWAHCASGCVAFVHVVSQWIAKKNFISIILRLNWYIQWTWIKMKCGGKQHVRGLEHQRWVYNQMSMHVKYKC